MGTPYLHTKNRYIIFTKCFIVPKEKILFVPYSPEFLASVVPLTSVPVPILAYIYTQAPYWHIYIYTHKHLCAPTYTHIHTQTHAYFRTHTHTYTHIHTHTHTWQNRTTKTKLKTNPPKIGLTNITIISHLIEIRTEFPHTQTFLRMRKISYGRLLSIDTLYSIQ